ncbi:MAG: TlpA family protein disulfide reductase [Stenotrophomonas sp.]|nr:TlpA family protein disulfide reductase [Stenotrophomonas sp.]
MMSLGPVPLPVALAISFLLLALLVARLWPRPPGISWRPATALLMDMFLLGLLAARAVFVLRAAPMYLDDPWSILRIGDGGFDPIGFFVFAAGWGAWKLRRHPPLRPAVLAAMLLAAGGWWGATVGLQHWQAGQVRLPEVELHDLAGQPVALAAGQGRPVVVNLWASWCGPCIREMPVLAAAQQAHPQVRFLFVNQGEDAATVQEFLRTHAPGLQGVLLDEPARTGQVMGVQAYPSTLFFDRQGQLRELHLGELTAAGLEHKLRRLR